MKKESSISFLSRTILSLFGFILVLVICTQPKQKTDFQTAMERLVRTYRPESSCVALAIYSLRGDSVVFGSNEYCALKPASDLKLLTTACALENWDEFMVSEIEKRLHKSRLKIHRLLLDSSRAESLGIGSQAGPPGYRYLVWTNYQSDNRLANWLLQIMGKTKHKETQKLIAGYLETNQIPQPGLKVIDGSGRSTENRLAPITLVMLLRHMYRSGFWNPFMNTLPQPGSNSTLRSRGLGLGSRIRAKTGYIKGTFALSGYLFAENDTFAFSFIVNNCQSGRIAYRLFTKLLLTIYHWDADRNISRLP